MFMNIKAKFISIAIVTVILICGWVSLIVYEINHKDPLLADRKNNVVTFPSYEND